VQVRAQKIILSPEFKGRLLSLDVVVAQSLIWWSLRGTL